MIDAIPIYADETLEDLQRGGFRLLQKKSGFRFGLDSVLLAAYAVSLCPCRHRRIVRVVDLGAGCGAVSVLMAARRPDIHLTGLEIDPMSYEVMQRNIRLNDVADRLTAVLGNIHSLAAGDWKDAALPAGQFDLAVSNPPYVRRQTRRQPATSPADAMRRQAREETSLDLDDLLGAAARLLRPGGRLALVYPVRRLPELFGALRDHGLAAKTMRLIQPLPDRAPATCLISATRQGRPDGFVVQTPLTIMNHPGIWSDELASLYGREDPLPAAELMRGLVQAPDRGGSEHV